MLARKPAGMARAAAARRLCPLQRSLTSSRPVCCPAASNQPGEYGLPVCVPHACREGWRDSPLDYGVCRHHILATRPQHTYLAVAFPSCRRQWHCHSGGWPGCIGQGDPGQTLGRILPLGPHGHRPPVPGCDPAATCTRVCVHLCACVREEPAACYSQAEAGSWIHQLPV